MSHFIYLRGLRQADHTVFCVDDGQKTYWDAQFNRPQPYSSGQQVKRSILTSLVDEMGIDQAPITFNFEVEKKDKQVKNVEPWSPCDPEHPDQLVGGWMRAKKNTTTIKRRSPLSISALRPLHPLLANTDTEDVTFDRSSAPEKHNINIHYEGKEIGVEEAKEVLEGDMRNLSPKTWIGEGLRTATGLFVYDVAIDLRRLFTVSASPIEPELDEETKERLKSEGWTEGENAFGPCLIAPEKKRKELIPALAKALIDWQITSNQARTFSPMPLLALAVSEDASTISSSIRARLQEDTERDMATPVLDDSTGAELFKTPMIEGYVRGEQGSSDALKKAEQKFIELMETYKP